MAGDKIVKKKKSKEEENTRWHSGLKQETKYSIWGIICLGFSLFLLLSIVGKAGWLGGYVHSFFGSLFGKGLFLVLALCFFAAIILFSSFRPRLLASSLMGGGLLLISALALTEIIFDDRAGGYIGFLAALPVLKLADFWAALVFFAVIFIVGFLIMFNLPVSFSFLKVFRKRLKQETLFSEDDRKIAESLKQNLEEIKERGILKEEEHKSSETNFLKNSDYGAEDKKIKKDAVFLNNKFQPPSLDLLETDKGKPSGGDIRANANVIKRTLQNFGINVEMDEVRIGPSVTQYALKPAEGVKLARITALNNDLALALAAHPIRIEAPIPGKSQVGIEVPNHSVSLVGLRHLLAEPDFQNTPVSLFVALGRNVAGRPVYVSLSKMPHLLIAGATGSGKSVCIHSLIMSLLYRHSPADLKLLLIDPKRVELTIYNDLPSLFSPVITDAKKAIKALRWVTNEMERRYDILLNAGVRDIGSFHQKKADKSMPYIVIVIDELADIMATYPREFESSIVRLAQMSRAVGIHLVVSTQRPSVEVITGLIKANITSRIAFQVASQVDSRTILDMAGAEKLLGNGDMLYLSGDSAKPRRIQGSFVSEKEIHSVTDYLIKQYENFNPAGLDLNNDEVEQASIFTEGNENEDLEHEDEIYEEARDLIIQAQKASSSYLQRRLRIGYARAARLLDVLEERGVVGPQDASKPRDVLVNKEGEYQS